MTQRFGSMMMTTVPSSSTAFSVACSFDFFLCPCGGGAALAGPAVDNEDDVSADGSRGSVSYNLRGLAGCYIVARLFLPLQGAGVSVTGCHCRARGGGELAAPLEDIIVSQFSP